MVDETTFKARTTETHVQAISFGGNPHHDPISAMQGRYPSLPADTRVGLKHGPNALEPGNWFAVLTWSAEHDLDKIAPKDTTDGAPDRSRHLLPALPGHHELLSPIMMWWILLFGLSVFARYHPGLWVDTLDVDDSALAVPLEGILDRALVVVPALISEELLA